MKMSDSLREFSWPMKRNFLEKKIGVLMVRKDIVKGQNGRVHSGHLGARKGRTGPVQQNDGWKRGRRKQRRDW